MIKFYYLAISWKTWKTFGKVKIEFIKITWKCTYIRDTSKNSRRWKQVLKFSVTSQWVLWELSDALLAQEHTTLATPSRDQTSLRPFAHLLKPSAEPAHITALHQLYSLSLSLCVCVYNQRQFHHPFRATDRFRVKLSHTSFMNVEPYFTKNLGTLQTLSADCSIQFQRIDKLYVLWV